ncbi:hypothetical protein PR002_g20135 [Phytophthora rubi]|uniref:Uncharacterized protein n=1 Tax=Phytophthora rubi TaxID=129364 RepID=A0A6A3JQ79_9STRA|nr:hypothetical protein PR002_g20135 [Phytophthora rubi]
MCLVLRAIGPAWKPASHIRTATTSSSSSGGGSSSSIPGRGTARWIWCKPRLEGSRASHFRTATTTSSGGGSGSCIAGWGAASWGP